MLYQVHLNPFTLRAAKTSLTILEISYWHKHVLGKILSRNVTLEVIHQLPFKWFVNFLFIPKLYSKVWEKQTILARRTMSVNVLNEVSTRSTFMHKDLVQSRIKYFG